MVRSSRAIAKFVTAVPLVAALAFTAACSSEQPAPAPQEGAEAQTQSASSVEKLGVDIVERYDFDDTSFTQGLEVTPDGTLLVSTGQEGESRIYRSTIEGEELDSSDIDPEFFGEGITRYGDHIWQLTWLDNTAIKRDAETLEEIDRADFPGEGWGLCSREAEGEIIFSDGTDELRRVDPDTLAERERFHVTMDGAPVDGLNELECVGGDIYANIFTTTDIVRIDAATGEVTALIDASTLPNNATDDPNHVLNGIAHLPASAGAGNAADSDNAAGRDEFLLAGKRWPDLYRVVFVPRG